MADVRPDVEQGRTECRFPLCATPVRYQFQLNTSY